MIYYILGLMVFPIMNMLVFSIKVKQYRYNRNNRRVFKKIAHEFIDTSSFFLNPKSVEEAVKKNKSNIATHLSDEFIKNYRKLYNAIWHYCVGIVISMLFLIIALVSLFFIDRVHIDIYLLYILLSGLFVLGIEAPFVFRFLGSKQLTKIADILDRISYEVISPEGTINSFLLEISTQIIIFSINLLVFLLYVSVLNKLSIPKDLIIIVFVLFVYQYLLLRVFSYCLYKIFKGYLSKQNIQVSNLNFSYIYHTMKNNTYLLLLIFYLITKYIQVYENTEFGVVMAESIGILFLFDTYIAQYKEGTKLKDNSSSIDD